MTKLEAVQMAQRDALARHNKGQEFTVNFASGLLETFALTTGFERKSVWINDPTMLNIRDHKPIVEQVKFDGKSWNFGLSLICDESRPQQISIKLRCFLRDPQQHLGDLGILVGDDEDGAFAVPGPMEKIIDRIVAKVLLRLTTATLSPTNLNAIAIGYEH